MLDPDKLLNQIVSAAAEATQSDAAAVFLKDDQGMSLRAAVGCKLDEAEPDGLSLPMTILGVSGADSFRPRIISEADFLPTKLQSFLARHGLKSVLVAPIVRQSNVMGLLFLASRKRLGKQAENAARKFSELTAGSLEIVRQVTGISHELEGLKWLAGISDKIRLEEGRDKVLSAVLEAGMEVLDADATVLYLLDDESGKLSCAGARGILPAIVDPKWDEQQTALLDALANDDQLVIPDIGLLPEGHPMSELVLDVGIRSILGLQLRHRGRAIGLLTALYRQAGSAETHRTELSRVLALNAAVALNYSRMLDQSRLLVSELEAANVRLEQLAVQDGLTGLCNHRAFHQRLTEQVHRVGRYSEIFSVVMFDVDHFKSYNDAYGHQEGDLALQQIARIIASEIRECDVAARYGGEEFAVILPQIPKTHARLPVERIRSAVDTFAFRNGRLSISAGIAESPSDGVTANEVLEKADRALYHAKLTGRNRICIWGSAPDEQQQSGDPSEIRPVSVLVVENDGESRRLMEDALRLAGYELHRAFTTEETIGLLRTRKFDIMLSDALILNTEGMQVLGLASAIHPTMPIVVTTMPSTVHAAREAMRHGVTDMLVKPFNENELPVVIERNLERKRLERQMLLERSTGILLQAIDALVAAIDAKDRLTAGHSARVTNVSLAISDTLGLPSEERYTLELAARLHDIGKLSLPDSAMNKPGRLSDEEWAAMRRHPAVGSQIVGAIEELSYIATIVRHHHERLDGNGYPDGLQGEAIPFLSRIIAVADAFEAMTNDRSFRQKMTTEEAIVELRRCVGTHYSSEVVEAFVESIESGVFNAEMMEQAA